jgi:hypothetical protein
MDSRKLYEALGSFAVTFISGLAVYKGFTELTVDSIYQPVIQGLMVALGVLGFRSIPSKPA